MTESQSAVTAAHDAGGYVVDCPDEQPQQQGREDCSSTETSLPATTQNETDDPHEHGLDEQPQKTSKKWHRPMDITACAHQQLKLLRKSKDAMSLFTMARTLGVTYHRAAQAFVWLQTLGYVELADPPGSAPLRPRRLYYRPSAQTRKKSPSENDLRIQIRTATLDSN